MTTKIDMQVPPRRRKIFDPRYVRYERRRSYILACILFWSILFFSATREYVFTMVEVDGPSMSPTLIHGERLLMHRWPLHFRQPVRGDVVALGPFSGGDLLVKRIIALPGETIQVIDQGVYVNGHLLEEAYLGPTRTTYTTQFGQEPVQLAPDEYFVLGDNRGNSEDSRTFGPVQRSTLLGFIRL